MKIILFMRLIILYYLYREKVLLALVSIFMLVLVKAKGRY